MDCWLNFDENCEDIHPSVIGPVCKRRLYGIRGAVQIHKNHPPNNKTIDYFDDTAAILNRKVLWGVQGGEGDLQSFIIVMASIYNNSAPQDGFTRDELRRWTVPQLSRFLKDRGVVFSADGGRIEQLIDKVYYAKQLGLEVLRTEQQITEDIAPRRKEKLTFDGILLPFPENVHNWLEGSRNIFQTLRFLIWRITLKLTME